MPITQLKAGVLVGARYGSFAGKEEAVAETGHVYELTGSLSTFALEGTL